MLSILIFFFIVRKIIPIFPILSATLTDKCHGELVSFLKTRQRFSINRNFKKMAQFCFKIPFQRPESVYERLPTGGLRWDGLELEKVWLTLFKFLLFRFQNTPEQIISCTF